jgi:hypothetical protein
MRMRRPPSILSIILHHLLKPLFPRLTRVRTRKIPSKVNSVESIDTVLGESDGTEIRTFFGFGLAGFEALGVK